MKTWMRLFFSRLICVLFLPASYATANQRDVESDMLVSGRHGTVFWQGPLLSEQGLEDTPLSDIYFLNYSHPTNGLPSSGLGIVSNCEMTYHTDEDKSEKKIYALVTGVAGVTKYTFPKPVKIASYSVSCRSFFVNEGREDLVLDGRLATIVSATPDGTADFFNGYIASGTLGTTPSCTLSIPDPVVNMMGSEQGFRAGISRKVKIDAACKGASTATVFLNAAGARDAEGCVAVSNSADDTQLLRMCAAGYSFDGAKGKPLTLDKDGKSSDEIEFKLSSYNHQQPAPGEYKSVVYAVISPS